MANNESNTIRIIGVVDPPYVTPCFKDFPHNCPNPGIDIMFLYYQLVAHGYQVTFIQADNITSAYKLLTEGFADITGFSDNIRVENPARKALRVTMPIYEDHVILYHKDGKKFDPPNLLIDYCPYSVWAFVLFTFVAALSFKIAYKFILTKSFGQSLQKGHLSPQFPLLAWNFCFAIFSSIYSQYLGITLSTQFTPIGVPFNDVPSLLKVLKSGECTLVMNKRSMEDLFTYFSIMNETARTTKDIHVRVFETDAEVVKMIKQPECHVGMALETYFIQMNAHFGGMKAIHLFDMPTMTYFYFCRKHRPFKDVFDIINAGSAHNKYSQYLEIATNEMHLMHKVHQEEDTHIKKPLSLKQLASGFWLLVIGHAISILVFCITKLSDIIVTKTCHKCVTS